MAELNAMARNEFTSALGWIFEDSPWVASQAWEKRPFSSRQDLHRALVEEVENAGRPEQLALLRRHPDLGTRARVSGASAGEQAGVGLDCLTPEEFGDFTEWNRAYRDKFGIPFLYAVKGTTKQDILNALWIRMESSPEEEFRQALWEVYRIAWFRMESAIAP
jgi:2-oxo-4-hydroxy-4-carboxy-5-ureidoimidazoline decarboxylase